MIILANRSNTDFNLGPVHDLLGCGRLVTIKDNVIN